MKTPEPPSYPRPLRRFLWRLAWFLPLILLVGGVNLGIDSANLFRPTEKQVARWLLDGQNVEIRGNLDERLLQKALIEGMPRAPEVLVIGSSRVMEIRNESFPGKTVFNSGVSGATVEDYLSIYRMYDRRGLRPATVVLGLDPWILNEKRDQPRWKAIGEYYREMADRIGHRGAGGWTDRFQQDKWLQLVSPRYFQESLKGMFRRPPGVHPTQENLGEHRIYRPDGSIVYEHAYRSRAGAAVDLEVEQAILARPIYSLSQFKQLDADSMTALTLFTQSLRSDGVEILFYLAPYHPAVYRYMMSSEAYRIVQTVEETFRELARSREIRVVGSYDPAKCAVSNGDFYDSMHPRREVAERLFKEALR